MIIEQAILNVKSGQTAEFEKAFAEAQKIITAMPGFQSLTLATSTPEDSNYLLLVTWEKLEDHTEGFRKSSEYRQWSALLHHFYEPFPRVHYYRPILTRYRR